MEESKQRKKFLNYYLNLRNIRESAIKAGYCENEALSEGLSIFFSPGFRKRLSKLGERSLHTEGLVRAGLERLAFGSINDAVKLLLCEDSSETTDISKLDLFNVSELKRVKGGGIEIKLFDRQKALEKLWEMENTADINSSAESFFNAIKSGAEAISQTSMGDD